MNNKAVIFDLDGVVIDSLEAWLKVFNIARQHYKLPEVSKKEFLNKIWGGSIERNVEIYFKGKSAKKVSNYFFSNMHKFKADIKLNPDAEKTIKALKNKNIKIGLVTNTYKKPALQILEHHKIKELFDAVVGGDEVKNGKPAPDSLFEVCKRLGIKPEEAVLIGDTNNDKEAAKNANMFFVGYRINGDLRIDGLKYLERLA